MQLQNDLKTCMRATSHVQRQQHSSEAQEQLSDESDFMIEYNFTEVPDMLCAKMLSLSCDGLCAVAQVEVAVSQDNDQDKLWLFRIGHGMT